VRFSGEFWTTTICYSGFAAGRLLPVAYIRSNFIPIFVKHLFERSIDKKCLSNGG
jgi:hypothetical protein